MRVQTEPIAVIILAVTGLALGLLAWAWLNSSLSRVSREASLAQTLAFERVREFARVISAGADPSTGMLSYTIEFNHLVRGYRRWFAFTILAVENYGSVITLNVTATKEIQQAFTDGRIEVYTLRPKHGAYIATNEGIHFMKVNPEAVNLVDGSNLFYKGVDIPVTLVLVDEYTAGIGDSTPNAIVQLLINPNLKPLNSTLVLVTFTGFNNEWYEVTYVVLP